MNIGGYTLAIVIGVLAVVLFLLGVIFRKRLLSWIDMAYDKLIKL